MISFLSALPVPTKNLPDIFGYFIIKPPQEKARFCILSVSSRPFQAAIMSAADAFINCHST